MKSNLALCWHTFQWSSIIGGAANTMSVKRKQNSSEKDQTKQGKKNNQNRACDDQVSFRRCFK